MKKVKITLVSLKDPCTACNIIFGLIKETLEKIQKEYSNVEIDFVELEHIKNASEVEGLEVEKFPAVLVNGEQITAGSLLTKQQLVSIIEMEGV
ncbi:MAG TPA: thioredoxin family protein [Clostridiaceae bacterium]|nr:thioredoxin family protein [Clostridiaceae bacterium]